MYAVARLPHERSTARRGEARRGCCHPHVWCKPLVQSSNRRKSHVACSVLLSDSEIPRIKVSGPVRSGPVCSWREPLANKTLTGQVEGVILNPLTTMKKVSVCSQPSRVFHTSGQGILQRFNVNPDNHLCVSYK